MGSRFPIFRDHYFDSGCWQLIIQTHGVIYRSSGNLRYATAKTYNLAWFYLLCITYGNLKVSLQTADSSYYYTKGQVLEVHTVSEYVSTFPDLIMKYDSSPDLMARTTYNIITGLHPPYPRHFRISKIL